jgi:Flp pilus assembly protein TadD
LGQLAIELDRLTAQLDERVFGGIDNTLGTIRLQQGRGDDAVEEFRKAIQLDPTNGNPHTNVGLLLMARGSREEGVTVLEEAAALRSSEAEAHFRLGSAYRELGRLDEAARSLAKAVELASDWYRDCYTLELGKVLLEARAPDKALTAFESARTHMGGVARVGEAIALRLAHKHIVTQRASSPRFRSTQKIRSPGASSHARGQSETQFR